MPRLDKYARKDKTAKMYIIGGELKGRHLVFTKNPKVRPMTQLVREALFNIWRDQVDDADMLDLFCGSGSVGIEALKGLERSAENNKTYDLVFFGASYPYGQTLITLFKGKPS
ncbi:MAG: hypothetical protein EHM28_07650 [Spirochaetaceae bacterium]|nr:MAG: hypothetical protein EHM28_07650 [Spirochaetaceae bacterium]